MEYKDTQAQQGGPREGHKDVLVPAVSSKLGAGPVYSRTVITIQKNTKNQNYILPVRPECSVSKYSSIIILSFS